MKDSNVKIGMRVRIKSRVPNFAGKCGVVMEKDRGVVVDKDCWFLMGKCYRILFDDGSQNYFNANEFKKVKA